MEGEIEGTGRRRRRLEQLLDDVKLKTVYWNLKETVLDRTLWRTRSARGCGPVVRQRRSLLCAKGTFRLTTGSAWTESISECTQLTIMIVPVCCIYFCDVELCGSPIRSETYCMLL